MNYVLDDKGNKIEAYSKEEILSVLQQCIDDGSLSGVDAQSAFVSKLKCCVGGDTYPISFVTQAKYNELKQNNQLVKNQLYFITDDTTEEVLEQNINDLWTETEAINKNIEKIVAGKVGDVIFSIKKPIWKSNEPVTNVTLNVEDINNKVLEIGEDKFKVEIDTSASSSTKTYSGKGGVFLDTLNGNIAVCHSPVYKFEYSGGSTVKLTIGCCRLDINNNSEKYYYDTSMATMNEIYEVIE